MVTVSSPEILLSTLNEAKVALVEARGVIERGQEELQRERKAYHETKKALHKLSESRNVGATSSPPIIDNNGKEILQAEDDVWLIFGVPTVARKSGVDYLTETLQSYYDAINPSDSNLLKFQVWVMHMNKVNVSPPLYSLTSTP